MSAPLPPAPAPSAAAPAPPTGAAPRVRAWLLDFQNRLCAAVKTANGSARCTEENWTRPGGGGGGLTRILAGGPLVYPRLKRACDDCFFLKHRNEPRGIGGLFFDDRREPDFDGAFAFVRDVGDHFWPASSPIAARRRDLPANPAERRFQNLRRGRFVGFNLVRDRGTLFGLQSGGRTESSLMSLPPHVGFARGWQAAPGSREAELTAEFLRPRDWADERP